MTMFLITGQSVDLTATQNGLPLFIDLDLSLGIVKKLNAYNSYCSYSIHDAEALAQAQAELAQLKAESLTKRAAIRVKNDKKHPEVMAILDAVTPETTNPFLKDLQHKALDCVLSKKDVRRVVAGSQA